jgi:phosphoenolpyruvate synthase/pyruvate phosphate dikinase
MTEEWFSMETIRRINPFHAADFFRYVCVDLKKEYGIRVDGAASFHSKNTEVLFKRKHFNNAAKKLAELIIQNPKIMVKEHNKLIKASKNWKKISDQILKKNLSKLSDKKLAELACIYGRKYSASHRGSGGHMLQLTEWENELYTRFIQSILEKKIKKYSLNESPAEAFTLVSTPEKLTNIQKEEKELFGLYFELLRKPKLLKLFRKSSEKEIEKNLPKSDKSFSKKLDVHHKKWLWLPFMYEGPSWEKSYFIGVLSSMARQYLSKEEIELKKKEPERLIKRKKDFLKKLPLTSKEKIYFKILSDSVYLKGYRKDVMYFSCYASEKMFSEIGKRLHLSLNQTRSFLVQEIKQAILYRNFSVKELNDRLYFTLIKWINGKEEILTREKARAFFNKVFKLMKIKKVSKLQGSTAVPGLVKGIVKVVNHPNEMYKMNQGDILVSHSTNPNLVPAMKKAGAIITDIGGVTCHAAIVSRELNIPCVIGTKVATRILKDGEKVEVNASKGTVKLLKKAKS